MLWQHVCKENTCHEVATRKTHSSVLVQRQDIRFVACRLLVTSSPVVVVVEVVVVKVLVPVLVVKLVVHGAGGGGGDDMF